MFAVKNWDAWGQKKKNWRKRLNNGKLNRQKSERKTGSSISMFKKCSTDVSKWCVFWLNRQYTMYYYSSAICELRMLKFVKFCLCFWKGIYNIHIYWDLFFEYMVVFKELSLTAVGNPLMLISQITADVSHRHSLQFHKCWSIIIKAHWRNVWMQIMSK